MIAAALEAGGGLYTERLFRYFATLAVVDRPRSGAVRNGRGARVRSRSARAQRRARCLASTTSAWCGWRATELHERARSCPPYLRRSQNGSELLPLLSPDALGSPKRQRVDHDPTAPQRRRPPAPGFR
ncbi:MAG: hypothetical protein RLZZ450_5889 [Pseudomonadota bacterium]|jgi:hypothetical protein